MKLPWDIAHAPTSLEDYVFNDAETKQFLMSLEDITHLMLLGSPGTGKTTLAELLVKHHGIDPLDFLRINASDDNNVDYIRDRVKSFIETASFGKYKVVLLDEADYLSKSAQAVLRGIISPQYTDNAKFILTGNYPHLIHDALKSRCVELTIKPSDRDDITELAVKILIKENIKFDLDTVDYYVDICYPDIRKTIGTLQLNSSSGTLVKVEVKKFNVVDYIVGNNWRQLRLDLAAQKDIDYEDIYVSLYQNLHLCSKFAEVDAYETGIVIIADYLSKSGMNPLITLIACIIELSRV
jgi:DNA polymerase III delta prime subunit